MATHSYVRAFGINHKKVFVRVIKLIFLGQLHMYR